MNVSWLSLSGLECPTLGEAANAVEYKMFTEIEFPETLHVENNFRGK